MAIRYHSIPLKRSYLLGAVHKLCYFMCSWSSVYICVLSCFIQCNTIVTQLYAQTNTSIGLNIELCYNCIVIVQLYYSSVLVSCFCFSCFYSPLVPCFTGFQRSLCCCVHKLSWNVFSFFKVFCEVSLQATELVIVPMLQEIVHRTCDVGCVHTEFC